MIDLEKPVPIEAPGPPTLGASLALPLLGILRPRRAAERLARAGDTAFWLTAAAWVLILALAGLAALHLHDALVAGVPGRDSLALQQQLVSQWSYTPPVPVAADSSPQTVLLRDVLLFFILLVAVPLAIVLLAWLWWPFVHRTGNGFASLGRAARGVIATLGMVLMLLLLLAAAYGVYHGERLPASLYRQMIAEIPNEPFIYVMLPALLVWLMIGWLNRAVGGVAERMPSLELPPRCEACGFDATHRPENDRCPECGRGLAESLTPGRLRPGASWQRRETPLSFLDTAWAVLTRPSRFYRRLCLRGLPGGASAGRGGQDEGDAGRAAYAAALRFSRWQMAGIAIGAAVWMVMMAVGEKLHSWPSMYSGADLWDLLTSAEVVGITSIMCPVLALVAWVIYRVVAAVSFMVCMWLGPLPDGRWAGSVVAYESAWLWAVCLYVGLWGLAMMYMEEVVRVVFERLFDEGRFMATFGVPPVAVVVFGGLGVVVLLWFERYRRAIRAVRWAGF